MAKFNSCIFVVCLLTPLASLCADDGSGYSLHVSPAGNDANPGTEGQPFATLERARDEIRSRKAGGQLPAGEILVELCGGIYQLPQPFELTEKDSGTESAPVSESSVAV